MKLNAQELRTQSVDPEALKQIKKNPIILILDNVLDTYNVGAIFRLADAASVERVYLCGGTETPPNSKIKKSSVNTWQWVDWHYTKTTIDAVYEVRSLYPGIQVVSVEQDEKSIPYTKATFTCPVALVLGNESYGISRDVLDASDSIVELPMYGINTSLNVMVSCGIVLYDLIRQCHL